MKIKNYNNDDFHNHIKNCLIEYHNNLDTIDFYINDALKIKNVNSTYYNVFDIIKNESLLDKALQELNTIKDNIYAYNMIKNITGNVTSYENIDDVKNICFNRTGEKIHSWIEKSMNIDKNGNPFYFSDYGNKEKFDLTYDNIIKYYHDVEQAYIKNNLLSTIKLFLSDDMTDKHNLPPYQKHIIDDKEKYYHNDIIVQHIHDAVSIMNGDNITMLCFDIDKYDVKNFSYQVFKNKNIKLKFDNSLIELLKEFVNKIEQGE